MFRLGALSVVVAATLLPACSSSDNGVESTRSEPGLATTEQDTAGATDPTEQASGGVEVLTGPIGITLSADAKTVTIGPAGGQLDVVDPAGTQFVLDVPPGALSTDVDITATPVAGFDNLGFDGRGVVFGPDGLYFDSDVTLRVTSATPIPVATQFMFTFGDDGSPRGAALARRDTADIEIILQHFSGYGVGDVDGPQQTAYLARDADSAQAAAESALAEGLNAERQSQLDGNPEQDVSAVVDAWKQTMLDQVVKPVVAAAGSSCAASDRAVATVNAFSRRLQLLGGTDETGLSAATLFAQGRPMCEREAIEQCKAAKDPSVLVGYWLLSNRRSELLGSPDPYPSIDEENAKQICDPKSYSVVGGADDFVGSGTICDLSEPFVISGSGVTVNFVPSSATAGSYTYGGSIGGFGVSGEGSYTVTLTDGGGTINAGGPGQAGGNSGGGTEVYTLTPIDPC
jgi:hypothetical protein